MFTGENATPRAILVTDNPRRVIEEPGVHFVIDLMIVYMRTACVMGRESSARTSRRKAKILKRGGKYLTDGWSALLAFGRTVTRAEHETWPISLVTVHV